MNMNAHSTRDQPGERYSTRPASSTVRAEAELPHAKRMIYALLMTHIGF
jgi:hypothetical protein